MPSANAPSARPPIVFADRDGTLVEDVGYLSRAEDLRLLPGVGEAVKRLNAANIPLVVVSNQSGVARGRIDPEFAARGGALLGVLLARDGAGLGGYRYCPHHVDGPPPYNVACDCRKPAPGMLTAEARERGLGLTGAVMIGDKISDVETGAALGVVPVLVRTGYGREAERELPADFARRGGAVVDDFPAAVAWILSRTRAR
jgi:D-glycero-D-manno-heptose 1,7-bisphosphate phosphatase